MIDFSLLSYIYVMKSSLRRF